MRKSTILGLSVLMLGAAFGAAMWALSDRDSEPASISALPQGTIDPSDYYSKGVVMRTDSTAILCSDANDGSCTLYASDARGDTFSLQILVDSPRDALLPSADGTKVLVTHENLRSGGPQQIVLIDARTFEKTVVFEAPAGMSLGLYTGFPSFVPKTTWDGKNKVKVSLYAMPAMEESYILNDEGYYDALPNPGPVEVKTVTIRR